MLCVYLSHFAYADTSIDISPNQTELTLPVNERFTYMFHTSFNTDSKKYYLLSLSKTVFPDDNGLLVEFPGNWAEWKFNTSTAPITYVFITPKKAGRYALSITATIHETGQSSSFTIPIQVNILRRMPLLNKSLDRANS